MLKLFANRVFLDTNILVYDFIFRNQDFLPANADINLYQNSHDALTYLRRNRKFKLYTASFSIARLASILQTRGISKNLVAREVEELIKKVSIVGLPAAVIEKSIIEFKNNDLATDIEDIFQFVVSRDNQCYYILTANNRDFRFFDTAKVVRPENHRLIVC
jgi:predicted nucleic acid-binding protein